MILFYCIIVLIFIKVDDRKIFKLYQFHGNFVLFTLLPIIIIDGGLMWGLTSPHMGPHFLIRIPAQKA